MTAETATSSRELPRLEYVGDPTHTLRVPELRLVNHQLSRVLGRQVDVLDAITTPTADRWDAMAYVAWAIHKRQDPQAQLGLWTGATAMELSQALAVRPHPERAQPETDPDAAGPTVQDLEDRAAEEGPTETTV